MNAEQRRTIGLIRMSLDGLANEANALAIELSDHDDIINLSKLVNASHQIAREIQSGFANQGKDNE